MEPLYDVDTKKKTVVFQYDIDGCVNPILERIDFFPKYYYKLII